MIINQRKDPIGAGLVFVGQARRLPAVTRWATDAVALQNAIQLFLFLKLDLLAEELRIVSVFRQKRSDRG